MNSQPLAARSVVVTRATDQTEPLVHLLRALGAEPVVIPLITIVEASDGGAALRTALDHLAEFDWLVVSSPNGAKRVTVAVHALTEQRPHIAAVGTATARAMTVPVDLVPDRQIAEGLIAVFPEGTGAVLLAQAETARPTLAAGLAAKGWRVEVAPAYRAVACVATESQQSEALSADAVLFASGSAVRAWVDVFGTSAAPPIIVIGPATAGVAVGLGLKVSAVAADYSQDGLVECLLAYFREHR